MYYFSNVIDDIENNLFGEIDYNELARKTGVSLYEFRRIFTFIAKVPIGEYVRKRRLSLAASELRNGAGVTETALKCGYDSSSSFSRAFKEFHGVSPTEATKGEGTFKAFTRLTAEIVTSGALDIPYEIFDKGAFKIVGYGGVSKIDDKECCESVWKEFYSSSIADKISLRSQIFAAYTNGKNGVDCVIGKEKENNGENNSGNESGAGEVGCVSAEIPASKWAKFRLNSTDDETVDQFYGEVLLKWLSSTNWRRREGVPGVEVFPADMSEDGFEWEIWIPIV